MIGLESQCRKFEWMVVGWTRDTDNGKKSHTYKGAQSSLRCYSSQTRTYGQNVYSITSGSNITTWASVSISLLTALQLYTILRSFSELSSLLFKARGNYKQVSAVNIEGLMLRYVKARLNTNRIPPYNDMRVTTGWQMADARWRERLRDDARVTEIDIWLVG